MASEKTYTEFLAIKASAEKKTLQKRREHFGVLKARSPITTLLWLKLCPELATAETLAETERALIASGTSVADGNELIELLFEIESRENDLKERCKIYPNFPMCLLIALDEKFREDPVGVAEMLEQCPDIARIAAKAPSEAKLVLVDGKIS